MGRSRQSYWSRNFGFVGLNKARIVSKGAKANDWFLPGGNPLCQRGAAARDDLGAIDLSGIHQVLVGGEWGPGYRPMNTCYRAANWKFLGLTTGRGKPRSLERVVVRRGPVIDS